jgi:hypothetical protein
MEIKVPTKVPIQRGSKMATGTQMQTVWAPGIRDLAETLETPLTEVKHQGELKLRHPEHLACGRLLQVTVHWKNRETAVHQAGHCPPDSPPGPYPPAHWLPPATGGLQHHQTLAPKLPRRHRQTGLDAKRVTPELLRLKFYCSWTGDCLFFFLFSFSFL